MRKIIFALLLGISSVASLAQADKPLDLAAGAPDRYIVVPGDTLWGIATRFLKDPYRWAELWRLNRDDVRNPQRIYPGQVLVLDRSGDTPKLALETIKVRPHEYVEPLKKEISAIPAGAIEPFITQPLVIEPDGLDTAARIVAVQDRRVLAGVGDRVFVTGVREKARTWQVFRPAAALRDPDSGEELGREAQFLGTAVQMSEGDPAEFTLRTATQEITAGDHLVPAPRADVISYVPRPPEKRIQGRVIAVKGGVNFTGAMGVVAVNRGRRDGIEVGHVLAADTAGPTVTDRFKGERRDIQLPNQKNALLFVFRVFDRVAYALVMESAKPLALGDSVRTP